jgi:peptidoglycan/xylan/chitin deacetylase (PgdA/CDA1 family)
MTEPEGNSIVGLEPSSRSVVLTYDDGPTPGVTDQLLSVLAEADATATFFVLLTRVRPHLGLLQEVLDAGHEIALHGPDHRRLTTLPPAALSTRTLPRILRDAKAELEDLASVPVRWFRPPYGAQNADTWRAVREADLTPVLWSVHCQDWLTLTMEDHLEDIRGGALAGHIVLLHDGFADAGDGVDDGPPPVLDHPALTLAILSEVGVGGLRPESLGAALASGRAIWRPWFDDG